jgi:nicotinamidase-related amidase
MKPAVIIVGMVEDNFGKEGDSEEGYGRIVGPLGTFLKKCRHLSIPVIFACDSFVEGDFIFKGGMRPHAIRGSAGAAVPAGLARAQADTVLPKRRFSAFFKTDLDQTLRTIQVDTVAVGGITTDFSVVATAMDALCHDFSTIILEDLCTARSREMHEGFMDAYRRSIIYPLLKVSSADEFLDSFEHG